MYLSGLRRRGGIELRGVETVMGRKIGNVFRDSFVESAFHVSRVKLGPDCDRLQVDGPDEKGQQGSLRFLN
jgi:hypothetical protein